MNIQSTIYRESPKVCRFALNIDGEPVKRSDDRVQAFMKENGITTTADLLRLTTSSLPADVIWPDHATRQATAIGVITQAQLMTDEQWESLDVKSIIPIIRAVVRLQAADLTTIAGIMVGVALADGRLKEAE